MRKMKKILVVFSIILTVLCMPTMAFATNSNDARIIEEAMNYLNLDRKVEESASTRAFSQTTRTFTKWRSEAIYVTRTPGSSGVTAAVFNYGTHYVDICLFNASNDQIIGSTKTVNPGQEATLSWTNSSMYDGGTTSEIYIFLTMYAQHENLLTITVSH